MAKNTEKEIVIVDADAEEVIVEGAENEEALTEADNTKDVPVKKDKKKATGENDETDEDDDDQDGDDSSDDKKDKKNMKEEAVAKLTLALEDSALGVPSETPEDVTDKVSPKVDGKIVKNGVDDVQEVPGKTFGESFVALLKDAGLSEEIQTKAQVVFEAAVKAQVKALVAEQVAAIKTKTLTVFEESVDEIETTLTEKANDYVSYVVAEWLEENKIAIDKSLQFEIYEDFFAGLKNLYLEHNISIPEESVDALEEAQKETEELTAKLNEATEKLIAKDKEILENKKEKILSELSEGLVATQVEKFKALVEEIDAKDEKTFREKATIIRESAFKATETKPVVKKDEVRAELTEEVDAGAATYAKRLSKILGRDE